ncbi:MAG: hypothetical protein GY711_34070 [bacterium]|nr:hypothetical protein [bacterium]
MRVIQEVIDFGVVKATGLLAICLLALPGCLSGLGPGDVQPMRYFNADAIVPRVQATTAPGQTLRLRRVEAVDHLRERIVWRISDVEYGFYELNRWTEQPVHFLERALSNELYGRRELTRSAAVSMWLLDVQLLAFEEIVRPEHSVRVVLHAHLIDASGESRLLETYEADVPVEDDGIERVAAAMRHALGEAVARTADGVLAARE